jgi:hypothetical protein
MRLVKIGNDTNFVNIDVESILLIDNPNVVINPRTFIANGMFFDITLVDCKVYRLYFKNINSVDDGLACVKKVAFSLLEATKNNLINFINVDNFELELICI